LHTNLLVTYWVNIMPVTELVRLVTDLRTLLLMPVFFFWSGSKALSVSASIFVFCTSNVQYRVNIVFRV